MAVLILSYISVVILLAEFLYLSGVAHVDGVVLIDLLFYRFKNGFVIFRNAEDSRRKEGMIVIRICERLCIRGSGGVVPLSILVLLRRVGILDKVVSVLVKYHDLR